MYSFEFLTSAVFAENPCGPDLDLEGDGDFLNFTAFADGILPASYFRFDRTEVDLASQITGMKPLLEATRDVRLLVILAKYQILDRQLEPFITTLNAIAALLGKHWNEVHPRAEDGDFALRINTLETLDDMAQVMLPLQHQPLFKSRRIGAISFRTSLLASGKLQPRENEEAFDQGALDAAVSESDIREMIATRDQFIRLKAALQAIQSSAREGMDFQGSVSFERLAPLVHDITTFLEQVVTRRDPSAAALNKATLASGQPLADGGSGVGAATSSLSVPGSPAIHAALPVGAIASLSEVTNALRAVGGYFATKEPASPALLLVRQAQSLVGKSFYEAIRALLPAHATEATMLMGASPGFTLSVERLAEVAADFPTEPSGGEVASDDGWGWDTPSEAEGETDAAPLADEVSASTGKSEVSQDKSFEASDRHQAFALMGLIQDYYARNEPASPVPLLLDRARHLGAMDFLALMRLVMPNGAFRQPDE